MPYPQQSKGYYSNKQFKEVKPMCASPYTKENNYGLGEDYFTLGTALPRWAREIINSICEQEEIKKGQLLRKWVLERIETELPISND